MSRPIGRTVMLFATVAAVGIGFSCAAPAAPPVVACGVPFAAIDDWQAASFEEAGIDGSILCSLNSKLDARPEMKVHAVVVARRGKLVFETYRRGDDENSAIKLGAVTRGAQTLHDVFSVSKSVVSLLVGVALDRRLIKGVHESVFSFFPEYSDIETPEKDRIELHHLLTMSAGLAADEELSYSNPLNTGRQMEASATPYRHVLERRVAHAPGEVWNYDGGCTMLLAAVLQKVTGKSLVDFAKEALFDPLGITDFSWAKMDASGEAAAASGLRLRPRDLAKIGQLLLNDGGWNGRQIISKDWIAASVRPRLDPRWSAMRYGYQWWVGSSNIGKGTFDWIVALGLGGQRLFVIPEFDLIVVINAGLYEDDLQHWFTLRILENFVLAALQD